MTYRLLADVLPRRCGSYSVRGIRPSDAEPIRLWRNAQLAVLRQSAPLSYEDQLRYFWEVVSPDFRSLEPRQILLTLLEDNVRVGYGGLTHLDWPARRGELSFLANPAREGIYANNFEASREAIYAVDFEAFLQMVIPIAFEDLSLHRVWHETYDFRADHIAVLSGYAELEGRLGDHARVDGRWVDSLIYGMVDREKG